MKTLQDDRSGSLLHINVLSKTICFAQCETAEAFSIEFASLVGGNVKGFQRKLNDSLQHRASSPSSNSLSSDGNQVERCLCHHRWQTRTESEEGHDDLCLDW